MTDIFPKNNTRETAVQDKAKTWGIASLILGILALLSCIGWIMSFVGFICAIVGLVLGGKAKKILPPEDRSLATAGWICCIVALCVSLAGIVIVLIGVLGFLGIAAFA